MISRYDLLVQAIGFVPSFICLTSLQSDNRKRILTLQLFCGVLWALHYGLLGAYTAVLTNLVGLLRAFLCYHNDKAWGRSRAWLAALIAAYLGCTALTWSGWYCALPCVSMILTSFALWTHNMRRTRLLFLLGSPALFVYNLVTGSWACLVIEGCAFVSFAVAVWRFDLRPAKRRPVRAPLAS